MPVNSNHFRVEPVQERDIQRNPVFTGKSHFTQVIPRQPALMRADKLHRGKTLLAAGF